MVRQKARPYDHLYDQVYTTSHPVDHQRATGKALYRNDKFKRVPDDKYLFSELPHYPRATMQMDSSPDLPDHVDRRWNPTPAASYGTALEAVSGSTRVLYFRRPVVPTLADLPQTVHYDMAQQPGTMMASQFGTGPATAPAPAAVTTKAVEVDLDGPLTVGTQTLYRESDAQTLPYSPEVVVPPGQEPEVLTLTHLRFNQGLPVTRLEIEVIERTRQKRIFDSMLPPPTDEFGYQLRAHLMEEQEFRDWSDREKKIKDLQEKRLQLLIEALAARDEKGEQAHVDKIARLRAQKEEERDRVLATTQRKRVQVLRKMFKARQQASSYCDGKSRKRDVIAEYADFTSTVYAPLRRNGFIPDTKTARIEVQPADLSSYPGLLQLERSLPLSTFKVKIEAPGEDVPKRKDAIELALHATMGKITKEASGDKDAEGGEDRRKKPGMRPIFERPETPRVKEDVLPEEEQQQAAVLLLQRILRGRAKQNGMFEGKEKRLDLINELRAAELWDAASTTETEKRAIAQHRDRTVEANLESVVGSVVSETLDQLSKELLRFQEERRIAAMVKLAERDRRLRQAQESGRRQAEERLRDREDKMFRQMMNVHQTTVDSYLEEVLTTTVDQAAKSRALTEARVKAAKVNHVVDRLEQTYQDEATTVRELVSSFLLPHVQREQLQRRLKVEEQRFSRAALQGLESAMGEVYSDIGN